ncbi:MAG: CrcB family protein [Sphingomicrobium sp.]
MLLAGWAAPLATLAVNIAGCLAMGLIAGWLVGRGGASEPWRLFVMTGVLGGFTTFSAFGLDALTLYRASPGLAAAYVAASLFLSLGAVALGFALLR